ncbi:MAG: FkbM family methyltransferase [Clostridia bacterium]|nr:FkbM family methyltransferase [Clostridia bacterium]
MATLPHYSEFKSDLWHYLASVEKPIVMYGMGNGADKIINVFNSYGIEVADFFASDGFVRGQVFHGKTVISFSAVKEKYDDFIVVVSFGSSLPDVLKNIYTIADNHELYAPDVPVSGETLFTLDFYKEHYCDFVKAFNLLCDEDSKQIYADIIRYKITGDISHLRRAASNKDCEKELLYFERYETFIDAGAYNGDTARKFISDCKNAATVYAIEPDRKNYKKLTSYAESETSAKVVPLHFGAWNEKIVTEFAIGGNRNSAIGTQNFKKSEPVPLNTIDSIGATNADYIKYDVEGAEKEALLGSVQTINASSPDLLVSLYHRSEDLFALPLLVNKLFPDYSLYLRRFEYIPAWDINLYAIKRR